MLSLTSDRRCSSAEISQRVSSSTMVLSSLPRWASSQPLQRACDRCRRSLLREWRFGEDGTEEMEEEEDRVGEEEGVECRERVRLPC